MTSEEIIQALLSKIDRAFINNRYPGDHGIGGEDVNMFRGNWSDISLEVMRNNRSEIYDFSTEGFAYYLPAFLKAIVTHPDEVDTLTYTVLLPLIPPEIPGDRFLIKVMEELGTEQKLAVRDFFIAYETLFSKEYGPLNAADLERTISYWAKAATQK